MPTWVIHVVGNLGVILILGAYLLVSSQRLKPSAPLYQILNLVGAVILVAYSIAFAAWASVVLNGVWTLIAVWALVRIRLGKAEKDTAEKDTAAEA